MTRSKDPAPRTPKRSPRSPDRRELARKRPGTALALRPGTRGSEAILAASVTKLTDASKQTRERFGRGLTLSRIEQTMLASYSGSMRDITDLNRETILFDPHLGGTLPKRLRPLSRWDYQVEAATGPDVNEGKAQWYAEVVRGQLARFKDFAGFLNKLSWALWDGRALNEVIWTEVNGDSKAGYGSVSMALSHWVWVHPRRLNVGQERQLVISDDTYGSAGAFHPRGLDSRMMPFKLVSWTPSLFGDYVEREGLAPACMYWSFMKRFAARERMILTELFGKPWRVVEVSEESQASDEDLVAAEAAADQLGATFSARMPRGVKLVIVRPDHGDGKIHQETMFDVDAQISKVLLGQTGTTDGVASGLNSSQSDVMSGEQGDICLADAALLSERIEDGLTDKIIELNFGADELIHAPTFRLAAKKSKDQIREGARLKGALDAGLSIKIDEAYEAVGFSRPTDEDSVVRIENPPTPPGHAVAPPPRPVIVYRDGLAHPPGTLERPPLLAPVLIPDKREPVTPEPLAGLLTDEQHGRIFELAADRVATLRAVADELCAHCLSDHRQPDGPNGNVETLLKNGQGEARRAVAGIVRHYQDAVAGKATTIAIVNALYEARNSADVRPLGRVLERRMVHAAALGALDADDETDLDVSAATPIAKVDFAATPFDAALKIFQKRKPIPRAQFDKLSGLAKQRAFTVAGVVNSDALATIQDELARVIGEGGSLAGFKKRIGERMTDAGFLSSVGELADGTKALHASHVETVFRTNVLGAYNAGRADQMRQPTVVAKFPVWEIRGVNDDRTRVPHKHAQGKKLLASDPFWLSAYPPFGYQCRCRIIARSASHMGDVVSGASLAGLPDEGFTSGLGSLLAPDPF